MYAALLLSLFTLLGPTDARSDRTAWSHVHPMSPTARHFLHAATQSSALVRTLMDELERTDVIVLFVLSIEPATAGRHPHVRFVTTTGNSRYVVLEMYTVNEPPVVQVPMFAHELRHALEIAAAPDVCDQKTFSRLFASIGWQAGPRRFETEAARTTERQVRAELAHRPL